MQSTTDRRRWLQLCGTGALLAVAGCVGDDDASDDSADDPGDDSGAAGEETTDDSADDSADDPDDSADDSADDPADDPDDSADDPDDSVDDSADDSADDPDDSVDGQTFGDVFNADLSSFTLEYEITEPEHVTGTMTAYEDDMYGQWSTAEGEIEIYEIGDTLYQVADGQCFKQDDERDVDFIDPEDEPEDHLMDLPVDRTTTINGEEAYVFEDNGDTWYISTSTGYPIRVETPDSVGEYHSWGETDPISPPDMDCTSFNESQPSV